MPAATTAMTAAGTKLHICADAPATYDAAGFGAIGMTWTEVGEIVSFGEFGRKYNFVKHLPLSSRRTVKRKGSYDDGNLNLQLARTPGNAGQLLIKAALASDTSYSYKVTLQDGTIMYFSAQCGSYTTNVGTTDTIVGSVASLEIDNDIIEVAPT